MRRSSVGAVLLLLIMAIAIQGGCFATELGVNVNERAELLDLDLIQRTQTKWVRAFMAVSPFMEGRRDLATDPDFARFKEASKAGYNTILSLKHNFYAFQGTNKRLPRPNTKEEADYFNFVTEILKHYAPYSSIIVLGNEPFIDTMPIDEEFDSELGGYPVAIFYKRLTGVVYSYLQAHPELGNPPLYMGAFTGLNIPYSRLVPPVDELLKFAATDDRIAGINFHPHVNGYDKMVTALENIRRYTTKPVISTEFSLVFLYQQYNTERLGVNPAGRTYAEKYGLKPDMQLYQYLSLLTGKQVPQAQWVEFLQTRSWFDPDFIAETHAIFEKYGVTVATYAFTTGTGAAVKYAPDFTPWIYNALFVPRLAYTENGEVATNYGFFEDFVAINQVTYAQVAVGDQEFPIGLAKELYTVELPYGTSATPTVQVRLLDASTDSRLQGKRLSYRIRPADALPGEAIIETYDEQGKLFHKARVQLHVTEKPQTKLTWGDVSLPAAGTDGVSINGMQPLSISSSSPTEVFSKVTVVLIPVEGVNDADTAARPRPAPIYEGQALPRGVAVDSSRFADGAYDLQIRLAAKNGDVFTETHRMVIDNWTVLVDELEPPMDTGWFGTVQQRKTILESDDWASVVDQAERLGDGSLLTPRGFGPQFLVWEADGFSHFALTVYVRDGAASKAIHVEVSSDMEKWTSVPLEVGEDSSAAQGWRKVVFHGTLGEQRAKFLRVVVEGPTGSALNGEASQLLLGQIQIVSPVTAGM